MKNFNQNIEPLAIRAEIDIRGRFLMMACDMEYTMLYLMMYSAPDPYNQLRRFKGMMMHNKIEATIADLSLYKPVLYREYENELGKLWDFKRVRNEMSHYKMHFPDDNDVSIFRMVYVDNDNGVERIAYVEHTIEIMNQIIVEFRKLHVTLAGLAQKLIDDHNLRTSALPFP